MKVRLFTPRTFACTSAALFAVLSPAQETVTNPPAAAGQASAPSTGPRRMAVVPFRPATGDSFSWNGASESSAEWTKEMASRLNERLVQTRKFTVLDRKFDAELDAELARLAAPNASPADAVRANQKLGTDYLIVGEVRFFTVKPAAVNPLTNQIVPTAPQKFADVSYRVLLAPTGQLKWADTITLWSHEFQAPDIASFLTVSAEGAAMRVADAVMGSVMPFEIVGKTSSGTLVIGEGGKSIAEGEVFTVYSLGEAVRDTRTGGIIDYLEEPVGDVQVTEVREKLSYARILGGDPAKMTAGARLRRPRAAPQAQPSAEAPLTNVKGTSTGGVVAPF
ncbi:MAG: hypothetical protein J6T01_01705 [Kiritimatiellae bacterium]|nr:hypothetical protein [Kiritimatiellia bacterium]